MKIKRLVIQKFNLVEQKVVFGPKEYVFIPVDANYFEYNQNKIFIELNKNKIKLKKGEEGYLLNEKGFQNKYFFKINETTNEIIKVELSNNSSINDSSSNDNDYSYIAKSLSSKTSVNDNVSKSGEDSSDKETSGNFFYEKVENNTFYRYTYCRCDREIDGIFNQHEKIDLITKGKIDLLDELKNLQKIEQLEEQMEKLKKLENLKSELNWKILFKNFDSNIIEKNEPIIIQVKQGFNLYRILDQIKQNAKIIGNLTNFNNNLTNSETKIIIPKYIIGFICTYKGNEASGELNKLLEKHKKSDKTIFSHIKDVLINYKINVVIILISHTKILEYPLNIEDYNIQGEKLLKRVDLEYMNNKIKTNKKKKELDEIISKFQSKYKSLTFIKKVPLNQLYEKDKENENLKKEIENQKKEIENLKKENVNQNNYIERLQKEFADLKEQIFKQNDELSKKIDKLSREKDELSRKLKNSES